MNKGCCRSVKSKGHALPGWKGSLLLPWRRWSEDQKARSLCSAVSTLEYQFAYAVERMTKAQFDVSVDEIGGRFDYELKNLPPEDEGVYSVLTRAFCVGLEMVSKRHPRDVEFSLKEA